MKGLVLPAGQQEEVPFVLTGPEAEDALSLPLDDSLIPGGWGIYRLTVFQNGRSADVVEVAVAGGNIAFDGTRLAIAGNGFTPFAAVWSGPELDFLATYHHSLDDSYLPTAPYGSCSWWK